MLMATNSKALFHPLQKPDFKHVKNEEVYNWSWLSRSSIEYTFLFSGYKLNYSGVVSKRKVEVVHSPQIGLGCMFMAIICGNGISCKSSNLLEYSTNSAFQHVCEAATYFPIFYVLPSSSAKFSLVVWALTRSVDRKLICGVMINIPKSTQRQLRNMNAHEILYDFLMKVLNCGAVVLQDMCYQGVILDPNPHGQG
ncbi:hypothetical protein Bca4012_061043 [Brassica carinata]